MFIVYIKRDIVVDYTKAPHIYRPDPFRLNKDTFQYTS